MCNRRIFADVIVLHLSSLAYDLTHRNRGKNVHATIPKVNMGYDQYTVPVTLPVKTSCFPLACANIRPLPHAIFSNFFEERRTQNHPQYLSGLSRALFSTTFLEIGVYELNVRVERTD